jgi:repressor LexA
MDKEFQENTLVLVKKQEYVNNNEIGVVLIDGMDATVKKIVINNNIITLIPCSNNPEHIPMSYDMSKVDVKILGKVVLAVKKY